MVSHWRITSCFFVFPLVRFGFNDVTRFDAFKIVMLTSSPQGDHNALDSFVFCHRLLDHLPFHWVDFHTHLSEPLDCPFQFVLFAFKF